MFAFFTTQVPRKQGDVAQALMFSQLKPVNPGAHVYSNVLGEELLQVPLLRQGFEWHIFKSISQFLPIINGHGSKWSIKLM